MGLIQTMREDVQAVKKSDPASESSFVIWLVYSGLHARWAHVIEHRLWVKGHKGFARWLAQWTRNRTGVEIHPGAQIGKRLFIDHGSGVVIGETAIVGDDCTIYQGVTLGGTGNETGKRHPTIGNNVMIGAGAKILGNITIGNNCKIGGGSVVLKDIPDNCTVVGIPGHIVVRDGQHVSKAKESAAKRREYLPDPVEEEIESLRREMKAIELRIEQLAPGSMKDLCDAPKGTHPGQVSTPECGCDVIKREADREDQKVREKNANAHELAEDGCSGDKHAENEHSRENSSSDHEGGKRPIDTHVGDGNTEVDSHGLHESSRNGNSVAQQPTDHEKVSIKS
jgi:serine O-acetyltransferase